MIHTDILHVFSPYLIASAVAYLMTECIKIIILTCRHREFRWREFFKTGGMPSSHSAVVASLATAIGLLEGFGTATFAIAIILAAIVITDATHVRRAVGEQGEVIKKIIEHDAKLQKPYFSRGHKPMEALVGVILGITIGIVVAYLSVGQG